MGVNTDSRQHQPATPAQRRDYAGLAGAGAFQPAAPHRGGRTEEYEEQGIHPSENRLVPVARGGEQFRDPCHVRRTRDRFGETERFGEGQPEDGESVGHADAKMNAQRGGWHQPPIEPGFRDSAFFGQEFEHVCPSLVIVSARRSPGFLLSLIVPATSEKSLPPYPRGIVASILAVIR